MTMFTNSLVTAGATSVVGILLVRFSYLPVMIGIAAVETALALLFRILMRDRRTNAMVPERIYAESVTD